MFYRMYLSSVCHRRQWPEPIYEPYSNRHGQFCKVRVNNREYSTDVPYSTSELAQDAAAMKAFMICRDFSKNDGRMPGQRPGQSDTPNGVVQGLPVAIGTGRRNARRSTTSESSSESDALSDGSGSGVDVNSLLSSSSASSSLGNRVDEILNSPAASLSLKELDMSPEQQTFRRPHQQSRQVIHPTQLRQHHEPQQHQQKLPFDPRRHPGQIQTSAPPPLLSKRGAQQVFSRAQISTGAAIAAAAQPLYQPVAQQQVCVCRRACTKAYGRCLICLREAGIMA